MRILMVFLAIILLNTTTVTSQHVVDSSRIVKVLTFNILHGATTKNNFDLNFLAGVIKDADPDFVAMQEVDFRTNRAKKYDLVTELGWRTKMVPLFAKAMEFDGGEYGEGVLSKYTFLKTRNVALPYSKGNEPRAALEVVSILKSGDTVAFIGTHLDHLENETDRIAQARKINEVFSTNKYPTILAGDLNAIPKSTPINILEQVWTSTYDKTSPKPTYPSNSPKIKIDYVMFIPKNKWRILETKVIQNTIASDHCAYLVTIELLN